MTAEPNKKACMPAEQARSWWYMYRDVPFSNIRHYLSQFEIVSDPANPESYITPEMEGLFGEATVLFDGTAGAGKSSLPAGPAGFHSGAAEPVLPHENQRLKEAFAARAIQKQILQERENAEWPGSTFHFRF